MSLDPVNGSFAAHSFSESHTVETPEQTNLEFTVAGVGSRFLAILIDALIQVAIFIVCVLALVLLKVGRLMANPSVRMWVLAGLLAFAFLLFYGYFVFFEIFWSGQTPGKRKIGLRVIKDNGRRLTPVESIARNVLRIVDQMPGFYGLGILVALLNNQNKRLGDFVAGSLVIREASLGQIKRSLQTARELDAAAALLWGERLTDDDLVLIESFLRRRSELSADVRARMAAGIFARIESRLTLADHAPREFESVLEAAAQKRRARLAHPFPLRASPEFLFRARQKTARFLASRNEGSGPHNSCTARR